MAEAKLLNESQLTIFQKVIASLSKPSETGNAFFVEGAAGTGKTTLLNHIYSHCESQEIKTIAMAYTGIASCLLNKGKTVHSQFRIPVLPWDRKSVTCIIDSTRPVYKTIQNASIILWDQATFCNKSIFEAVDRFLQIMMNTKQIFGGKVVVLCGDFNECPPIAKKTKFKSAKSKSLLFSELFKQMQKFTLHENVRFKSQIDNSFCLGIGSGAQTEISIPSQCRVFNLDTLVNTTYCDYQCLSTDDLMNRTILTVLNIDADYLNQECLERLNENSVIFYGTNFFRKIDPHQRSRFFHIDDIMLNLPKYFPSNSLQLNKNCPIMLHQAYKGLQQGTRLVVKKLTKTSIIAEIGAGHRKGKLINIYRVNTVKIFPNANLEFVRRQFPVSLAYSMTINKAQGLEFTKMGVYFPCTVFAHGQLYVAFSRTSSIEENMKILVDEPNDGSFSFDRMPNIVDKAFQFQLRNSS